MDQHYCFCELAPLYALGALSQQEQEWVEQQVHDCPELAEELNTYQETVTSIPYGAPIQLPSDNLKHRLFDQLELGVPTDGPKIPARAPATEAAMPPIYAVTAKDLKWQPHPVPGVATATLHIDLHKRELAGLLRAAPGTQYALHRHAGVEEIYMLTGDLIISETVYGAGDYIHSEKGSAHTPHTIGGCSFFFKASIDDKYLEPVKN